MKAALQEAEEAEENGEGDGKRLRDAKGREILSEEERTKKEEKDRKKAAEVCVIIIIHQCFKVKPKLASIESSHA